MERLQFCTAIYFYFCTHFKENEHRSRFFIPNKMDPNEKIILKIREDIATKPIEVNIKSTGIAQEEQVFFDTTDQQETTEKELWKRKEEV